MQKNRDPGSFRDPSGYVFYENDKVFRTVSNTYAKHYDLLMNSGLYDHLVEKKMLIPHKETNNIDSSIYKVISPDIIKTISYPYEWGFEQLKDVALRLLEIQKIATSDFGMTLKDATPFNFQFIQNNPVLIDTLSFEEYTEGQVWRPYQQFCELILGPLLLAKHVDLRLNAITQMFPNGVPLDITSKILPLKTKLMFSTLLNIHFHAKSQKKHAKDGQKTANKQPKKLSKNSFLGVISNLESLVKRTSLSNQKTTWSDYYDETNYNDSSFSQKQDVIRNILKQINPKFVLDLGSNTGVFAKIANEFTPDVVACDNDVQTINILYSQCKKESSSILPLVLDIMNPSACIGWANNERSNFFTRVCADTVMALALIHHISITNNVPFEQIAQFFAQITGANLIIEFVPKSDSQVQLMLSTKNDSYDHYTQENFEKAMCLYFNKKSDIKIDGSMRTIYHFTKLEN